MLLLSTSSSSLPLRLETHHDRVNVMEGVPREFDRAVVMYTVADIHPHACLSVCAWCDVNKKWPQVCVSFIKISMNIELRSVREFSGALCVR